MENSVKNKKQGYLIILSAIIVGILYQLIPLVLPITSTTQVIASFFNVTLMFVILYVILKEEFLDWFKHFSFKWLLIGIPFLVVVGTVAGALWSAIAGGTTANDINSILTWDYVIKKCSIHADGGRITLDCHSLRSLEKVKLEFLASYLTMLRPVCTMALTFLWLQRITMFSHDHPKQISFKLSIQEK